MLSRLQLVGWVLALLACGPAASMAGQPADPRVEAHLDKADAHFEAGDFQAAIREYDAAIAIAGPTELLLSLRGGARFRMGDYRGADADLTRAVKLDPQDGDLFLLRGLSRSLFKPPDRKGTCDDLEQARLFGRDVRAVAEGVDEWCAEVGG